MNLYKVHYSANFGEVGRAPKVVTHLTTSIKAENEDHVLDILRYQLEGEEDELELLALFHEIIEELDTDLKPPTWTTADGLEVPYENLTNSHLENIIEDGYRNPHLEKEANKRGLDYPRREVDKMTVKELMGWIESLNSTAIEGNKMAEWVLEPREEGDNELFLFRLNQLIQVQDEES